MVWLHIMAEGGGGGVLAADKVLSVDACTSKLDNVLPLTQTNRGGVKVGFAASFFFSSGTERFCLYIIHFFFIILTAFSL